jgi:hypothetical protein
VKLPIIELLQGPVNGSNLLFRTSVDYVPGSTQVFLNGVVWTQHLENGWDELGGRTIRMKEAPRADPPPSNPDVLSVYYLPLV